MIGVCVSLSLVAPETRCTHYDDIRIGVCVSKAIGWLHSAYPKITINHNRRHMVCCLQFTKCKSRVQHIIHSERVIGCNLPSPQDLHVSTAIAPGPRTCTWALPSPEDLHESTAIARGPAREHCHRPRTCTWARKIMADPTLVRSFWKTPLPW